FFFFSSRRRHTRSKRDWSSDVCSSDLDGPNDQIVDLIKSLGYQHHGFTTQYDPSSQVRWMGVLNLKDKTLAEVKKGFDSQRKRNVNKAHNYGVKVRFLEEDELDIFFKLYRETEERAGFISKTDEYFMNFINTYGSKALVPLAYIDLNEY